MTRSERFWIWTGRFSDEQCACAVLVGYVGSLGAFGFVAWLVMRG